MKPTIFRTRAPVRYIREQDGPPERELKAALSKFFESAAPSVRAYLVLGEADGSPSVFLVLVGAQVDREAINQGVGEIFRQMFKTNEHLDVVFTAPDDEGAVRQVSNPFFGVRIQ